MKSILTILLIIVISACDNNSGVKTTNHEPILGERIDGPANLRETINGKKILSLNDNILIETSPPEGQWLVVGLYVKLTKKQLEDFNILPNDKIISTEGKIVGKALDTVNVSMGMEEEGIGFIGGYTHIENIKEGTYPETVLATEIEKGNLSVNALKLFMSDFRFSPLEKNQTLNLKESYIYESTVVDPSPRDRITLLFNNEDNLVGIIHSRQIRINGFKTFDLIRGHSLTIISNVPERQIKDWKDKLITFYNSID